MSFMPYVAPEQMMKDRSEYAHKGIARGRSVIGLEYADGLLFIAENPSSLLHKISEIYDKMAFAGVGKYSEFEDLRIAGIRLADLRGYQYGREDVKARDLANAVLPGSVVHLHATDEAVRDRSAGRRGRRRRERQLDLPRPLEQLGLRRTGLRRDGRHAEELGEALKDRYAAGWDLATARRHRDHGPGHGARDPRGAGRADRGWGARSHALHAGSSAD
jgi:proteasome alpha subunit